MTSVNQQLKHFMMSTVVSLRSLEVVASLVLTMHKLILGWSHRKYAYFLYIICLVTGGLCKVNIIALLSAAEQICYIALFHAQLNKCKYYNNACV